MGLGKKVKWKIKSATVLGGCAYVELHTRACQMNS